MLKLIQRLTGYVILFLALLVILTGLDWYGLGFRELLPFLFHARYDFFLIDLIALHVAIGTYFALKRRKITGPMVNASILSLIILTTIFLGHLDAGSLIQPQIPMDEPPADGINDTTFPIPNGTQPIIPGKINIDGQIFSFNPKDITTIRPDLFNSGYFSVFDILVYLDEQHEIPLEYHFSEIMNTYVIDRLYNHQFWWYELTYSGGWSENNVFRMDHYPWKDGATLRFFKALPATLEEIYSVFREEISRHKSNEGLITIPEVIIYGPSIIKYYYNVTITAHNLRRDIFSIGIITAIDTILSLADQGRLTYDLKWYETIGTATVVKSYWIEAINGKYSQGRCGWVYESGSYTFAGFKGNHIHLPSDTRILNSPEYLVYFWTCA